MAGEEVHPNLFPLQVSCGTLKKNGTFPTHLGYISLFMLWAYRPFRDGHFLGMMILAPTNKFAG